MGACEDCLLYFICNEHSPQNDEDEKDCFDGLDEPENEYFNSEIFWGEFSYVRYADSGMDYSHYYSEDF